MEQLGLPSPFPEPPPIPDVAPDIRVGFVLSPRFTLLPFASFIDSLRHAADEADFGRQIYCRWKVIAPSLSPISASCGIEVTPHELFPDPTEFDYVVVIGGQLPWCLEHPDETLRYLRRAYTANVSIVGLCTGSFVLAKAGLLNDRRCAVHFEHRAQLVQLFPRCRPETDRIYVNDNEIITCPGGTSALDLAFTLIEARCGKARAVKGLTSLLVDRHRAAHHMPPRSYGHLATCGNRRVEQAVALMEQQLSAPASIAELAKRLNSSERELNRAFKRHAGEPPTVVWRKMRLAHGHWLLLNTTRTITQIALECGFADGAHFSRWFREAYRESPAAARRRHRNSGQSRRGSGRQT